MDVDAEVLGSDIDEPWMLKDSTLLQSHALKK